MKNTNNTILQGIMTLFAFATANDYHLGTDQGNRVLMLGILSILQNVFSTEQLIDSIKEIASGNFHNLENLLDETLNTKNLFKTMQYSPDKKEIQCLIYQLTPREKEVLTLMTNGLMNKEIANKIGLREGTIKCHVKSIFNKLNVRARTEAVVLAIKSGLIDINISLEAKKL